MESPSRQPGGLGCGLLARLFPHAVQLRGERPGRGCAGRRARCKPNRDAGGPDWALPALTMAPGLPCAALRRLCRTHHVLHSLRLRLRLHSGAALALALATRRTNAPSHWLPGSKGQRSRPPAQPQASPPPSRPRSDWTAGPPDRLLIGRRSAGGVAHP